MPASAAERKRRSRAKNPETTDEKDKNRVRMAIYRAKNKSAKRAHELKLTLGNDEKRNVELKAFTHKRSLICDWFDSHKVMMPSDAMTNKIILNRFMPRIDVHQIEHMAAQFEIALAKKIIAKEPPVAGNSTPPETPEEAERRKTRNRISKRRSRANNPETWSDEKEKSRVRMYIYRANNKSQQRALELHRDLSKENSRDVAARAADYKRCLIREWFDSRPDLRVSPELALANKKILNHIVSKLDMHKIEYKAAEFEISLAHEAVRARMLPTDGAGESATRTTPELSGNKGEVDLPEGQSGLLSPRAQPNSLGCNSTSAQVIHNHQFNTNEQDQFPKNDQSECGNTKEERRKSQSGCATTSLEAFKDHVTKDENTQLQYPWQRAIATLLDAAERMESEEENSSSSDGGQ